MDNGKVEAPKRADAMMNKVQLGKALVSNHRYMLPLSELGVNPNGQIAYMGDPCQWRALKVEAWGRVLSKARDDYGVTFCLVESYLLVNGPFLLQGLVPVALRHPRDLLVVHATIATHHQQRLGHGPRGTKSSRDDHQTLGTK